MVSTELDPWPALACYDLEIERSQVHFLGNHGGFSGARLWRIDWPGSAACLRAWPPSADRANRLSFVHPLIDLAHTHKLTYVPDLYRTRTGETWVSAAGRLWELSQWLPGVADFHAQPTSARLEAAAQALARLHKVWAAPGQRKGYCPAVTRRLELWKDWRELVESGWSPPATRRADPVASLAARAWTIVRQDALNVVGRLEPWRTRKVLLSPCLCDIWHDHVLFEGDQVTGIIDYGSVKIDHPTVDLARMLGSLVGDDKKAWERALIAYDRIRRIDAADAELAAALDTTGVIIGLTNWLRWLYHDGRTFEDRTAVAARMRTLVERIEQW